jgi:hypothetical protein
LIKPLTNRFGSHERLSEKPKESVNRLQKPVKDSQKYEELINTRKNDLTKTLRDVIDALKNDKEIQQRKEPR